MNKLLFLFIILSSPIQVESISQSPLRKNIVNLSLKEQVFIQSHPEIVLGSGDSWAPYVMQNNDGSISGYDHDILTQINQATGANFVQITGDWLKIQDLAKNKKLDGLSTLTQTKKRDKFLNFSNVYISLQKMVMVKQRNPLNIKSPKDLVGKTIVIHKGNVADEKISKLYKDSTIIYADTPQEMLEEVIYGKADATFGNGATEYMLSKLGLPYLENAFVLKESLDLHFAIRKDWNEAISILNKGLTTISMHKRNILKQKWFYYNYKKEALNDKINLTKNEKLYLKAKRIITMCVTPNCMPLEEIKDGKYTGFISDYIHILNKKINIPIELIITTSLKESLENIKQGKCDILSSAEKTPLREKYMGFSRPYLEIPLVIATKIGIGFMDKIEQVLNKKIAILKDSTLYKKLKQKYPNIQFIKVSSIIEGLRKVEQGEIFGYIDNSIVINNKIQNNYLGILAISGNFSEKLKLSIAFKKDESLLKDIFEKLVLSISIGKKQEILDRWINISYRNKIDYMLISQILLFFTIIILLFIYRQYVINRINRRLKYEIKNAIIKSQKQDKLIFQQNKLASMGEMIENIAHQWRQPLSQINSAVLIIDDELYTLNIENKSILDKLNEIEEVTKYMSNTIDDFKSFYKDDKKLESFLIKESVDITISLINASLKYSNIEILIDIDKNIKVSGFKNEFEQAILAILNNAKDILISKKILSPKIIIRLKITKDSYILTICDNGGGIKKENITKIFDPYFTTKHQSLGTGLGLYLSKNILEKSMKSKFYVKNINNGACFYIEFQKGSESEK